MSSQLSVIIPAWNEADYISSTLEHAIHSLRVLEETHSVNAWEVIVVDDGSADETGIIARDFPVRVLSHRINRGKGAAMATGFQASVGDVVMFIDADLGRSAVHIDRLLAPVWHNEADIAVAILPQAKAKSGFGLVKKLAYNGIKYFTGFTSSAPLSGQRAVKREVLQNISLMNGFAVEVAMTIDILKKGYRLKEVEIPFQHRVSGRNLAGFVHRGHEFIGVGYALLSQMVSGKRK